MKKQQRWPQPQRQQVLLLMMMVMSLLRPLLWDLQAHPHAPQLRQLTVTQLLLLLVVVRLRLQQVSTEAKPAGALNHRVHVLHADDRQLVANLP